MLVERSDLMIKEGLEQEFAEAMKERGLPLLASVPGVKSVSMGRGVENPTKFMLLVEWDAMAAHDAFKKTPALPALLEVLRPYSKGGAMEHFEMG